MSCAGKIVSLLIILSSLAIACGMPVGGRDVTIVSYNVHNLFDDVDDGTEYKDFDPENGTWTEAQFRRKLSAVAEAVRLTAPGGPDILALQEVEGERALNLLNEEYLRTSRYYTSVLSADSGSAVRVALLSRYPVTGVRNHAISVPGVSSARHILEAVIDIEGHELYMFINHWKSKSGGAAETESQRIAASRVLQRRISNIISDNTAADVVIVGDLNESTDEYSSINRAYPTALLNISMLSAVEDHRGLVVSHHEDDCIQGGTVLYSPWDDANLPGSYAYRGVWEAIDHIMWSFGLIQEGGLSVRSFLVVDDSVLLTDDGLPDTHRFSDHLPLMVTLRSDRSVPTPRVVEARGRDG